MLDKSFFERDAVEVAQDLIGCTLVRRIGGEEIIVQLTETEAYRGADDPASHASRGITPRSSLMFGEAGKLYVYFIYGMHYCMNIVTNPPGSAGAVLLRGAIPVKGLDLIRKRRPAAADRRLLDGPGKLCSGLGVTLALNGYDLLADPYGELTVYDKQIPLANRRTPRIGITKGTDLLWRFIAE